MSYDDDDEAEEDEEAILVGHRSWFPKVIREVNAM